MNCWICNSNKFVDNHHYDCKKGKISPETVPLCRRCHRTYHDRGVEWFDDEYLEKIIEIENKARAIYQKAGIRSKFSQPEEPLVLLKREDIQRSTYWNKTHGIKKAIKKPLRETEQEKQLGFDIIDNLLRLE